MNSPLYQLGNLLQDNASGAFFEVTIADIYYYQTGWKMKDYYPRAGLPIPITPAVLDQFGFIKEGEYFNEGMKGIKYVKKDNLQHHIFFDEKAPLISYMYADEQIREIEFVHQLQNLYAALEDTPIERAAVETKQLCMF